MAWSALHFWIVPRIGDHRPALENWAQQALGVPVRIGEISAKSTGWAPSFELRDIALLDPEGRTALRLPKVQIAISVRSVLGLKLEQLVLDAPEVDIRKNSDGIWRVAGLAWTAPLGGKNPAADWLFAQREVVVRGGVLHWTSEHTANAALPQRLLLGAPARSAQALTHPTPAPATAPTPTPTSTPLSTMTLRDVDLILRNSLRHHDMRLDATPPATVGGRFVAMGRFKRGLLSIHPGRWSDWSGQVHAFFPQMDLAQLVPHLPWALPMAAGQGGLRLWGDIAQGHWTGGLADLNLRQAQAAGVSNTPPMTFKSLSGRISAQLNPLGFKVATQQLAFVSEQGLAWSGGNLALAYTHPEGQVAARGELKAEQLDLEALRAIGLRMPLPEAWRNRLQAHEVRGQVERLQWRWQGDWANPQAYDAQASVKGLGLSVQGSTGQGSLPGLGLQGANTLWRLNQNGGRVDVSMGADGALLLPGILEEPTVRLTSLKAHAVFERTPLSRTPEKKGSAKTPRADFDTQVHTGLWRVPEWKLQLSNADVESQWQGQWQASADGGPGVIGLQGQMKQMQAARVHRYLPLHLSGPVRRYVRDAFLNGVFADVHVTLKGDLAQWPFANPKDGEFRVAGRLRDVEMNFLPPAWQSANSLPWPHLHKLSGLLVFERQGLRLSEASARAGEVSSGLGLTAGQVDIADLTYSPVLTVSAEHKGPAAEALALVQNSPLSRMLSGALENTHATGETQTRFKLSMPLDDTAKSQVQGQVVLTGNDVRMAAAIPLLENLQGTLQFSDTGFSLNGAQGRFLGGPVRIEGGMRPATEMGTGSETAKGATPPLIQLRAQGHFTVEALRQAPELSSLKAWTQQASGGTAYNAQLGWREGHPEFSLQSTLEGLALNLPAPLGKAAATSTPLLLSSRIQTTGSGLRDQLQIAWGQVASAQYVRDLSGPQPVVLSGSLSLGLPRAQAPALPASGVTAAVQLDRFSVDEWQTLLSSAAWAGTAKNAATSAWQSYGPTRFSLQANAITADGRTLNQVSGGGLREGPTWRVNVDARELSGHVAYRQAEGTQLAHLYARLSRLNLPPASVADVEGLLEAPPINLPSLDIVVEQLELRGKKLGRIEIEALNTEPPTGRRRTASEWQLSKLNITLPEANLRSTGRWLTSAEGGTQRKTEMNFQLEVNNAGALLTRLGTPDALRGSAGQLQGTVSWQGSPLALHYPSMSGQFQVQMGRGQFLKADAGVAKLLGVLSLQALPRRLLLDFRDVFYEGFAFDSVQGDVNIAQGIARTRNLQIKGVNALVKLEGSADIAQETQQLRVVILPALDAGTASLLAGIAVNPVVGLTTFLAQLFLRNPLMRANTQEFLIDGSWTDPKVTKINTGRNNGSTTGNTTDGSDNPAAPSSTARP